MKEEIEPSRPETSAKAVCRILAGVLAGAGVEEAVISPGSRNAPLILAFHAQPDIRTTVITDERSAAFVALGKAQLSQRPVALVCTSGTALLNYAPAVAEAYYQGIPLIVISADRPEQWIDQDDSQTLRQQGAFANFCKKSYDLADIEGSDLDWYANRTANDAVIEATTGKRGPVHINVHLEAPLSRTLPLPEKSERIISLLPAEERISAEALNSLACAAQSARILLVAGFMQPDSRLNNAVAQFAALPNVAVMAETVANLHLPGDTASVDVVLSTLSAEDAAALRPDIVITIGGAIISRKIKEFIREARPSEHWAIGHNHTTVDCFRALTRRIEVAPAHTLRKLAVALKRKGIRSDYAHLWEERRREARASADAFIAEAPWSDLKALAILFDRIPAALNLQLANGTSVRYAQLLTKKPFHSSFCNRGVSGIDGCTATAIGAASATPRPTLLLTGDMAFNYDLSAAGLACVPTNFRVVLLDNGGGGIFRFIDTTRHLDCREEFFCAPQPSAAEAVCSAFGWRCLRAADEAAMIKAVKAMMLDDSRPTLLTVTTPPQTSADTLLRFMNR